MSVSSEVQRTLVKSPPELWAELSNPEALARHLGELGELRITGVEPETKVKWETEGASGVVHLKQSSWGTKVTLSLTRETPIPEQQPKSEQVAGPDSIAEPGSIDELESIEEPEPFAELESIEEPEQATEPESEPGAEQVEPTPSGVEQPKPRRRFFARLFRRRGAGQIAQVQPLEPEAVAMVEPEPLAEPEPVAAVETEAGAETEPATDLSAELTSMEAQMAEQTTELLTGVLDRLGAAHHRPFSRG